MTGIHATKVAKSLNNKYSQKVLDSAIKSTTDAIKNASKKAIQKTAKATGDLISNKICAKITSISKSPKELHSNELHLKTNENETDIRKIYIFRRKTTIYLWIKISIMI